MYVLIMDMDTRSLITIDTNLLQLILPGLRIVFLVTTLDFTLSPQKDYPFYQLKHIGNNIQLNFIITYLAGLQNSECYI